MEKSCRAWEKEITSVLAAVYNHQEAHRISQWLMEKRLGIRSKDRLLDVPVCPSVEQLDQLRQDIQRLMRYEPVQYVLEECYFYGMQFKVSSGVLIPRRETEELVEWVLQESGKPFEGRLLDIGTGSGCIALALKKHMPGAQLVAWDVSWEALRQAKQNAQLLGLEVEFCHKDIFQQIHCHSASSEQWTIIVSNPPYVLESEKDELAPHVRLYEPAEALFVPDSKPLIFYEAIAAYARRSLQAGGKLYLEIHEHYGEACYRLLTDAGFIHVQLKKDMQNKDRMIRAVQPA